MRKSFCMFSQQFGLKNLMKDQAFFCTISKFLSGLKISREHAGAYERVGDRNVGKSMKISSLIFGL